MPAVWIMISSIDVMAITAAGTLAITAAGMFASGITTEASGAAAYRFQHAIRDLVPAAGSSACMCRDQQDQEVSKAGWIEMHVAAYHGLLGHEGAGMTRCQATALCFDQALIRTVTCLSRRSA
jgi:hypothetical protein